MKRVFVIVLDSFGIGELPDAANYHDTGSNTLASCFATGNLQVPQMQNLGLYNIDGVTVGQTVTAPAGAFGRMAERSAGKDTTTGHWELMGLVSQKPMPTYPQGFPPEVLKELSRRTGRGILCNLPYSGTQVIQDYGEEHLRTGDLIVYTSADSVLQIAAHEQKIPLDELYRICQIAREIMQGEHGVGRIIARPFVGEKSGSFTRTANRRDFSLLPPQDTLLDILSRHQLQTIGVGKISDIFAGKGISQKIITHSNDEGMQRTIELCQTDFTGLCFVNLVEFDMLYGHRNNPEGYTQALNRFDAQLAQLLPLLRPDDLLFITADHGCDPATPSTDHSREYVPLLCCGKQVRANQNLGTRTSFGDLAATIADYFGVEAPAGFSSFLSQIFPMQ